MKRNTLSAKKKTKAKKPKTSAKAIKKTIETPTAPKLIIKQHLGRLLLPELFIVLIVTAIFYGLILLNLLFLNIELPDNIHLFVLFILGSLVILHLLITWHNRSTYVFHVDELEEANKWNLDYKDIYKTKIKKDFFDKLFATGTLVINDRHNIKHIHRPGRIQGVIVQVKQ